MPRPKKSRPPREPRSIQVAYYVMLKKLVRRAQQLVSERLVPLLPMLMERATPGAYADALPPGKRANHAIQAIKNQLSKDTQQERIERVPRAIGKLVAEHNARQLALQGVPVDPARGLKKAVAQFTAENVALIRSVPEKYLAEVEASVHRAMAAGERHETLAKEIEERGKVATSRAAVISRDQVLKFNGSLNRVRMQNAGIESYVWRSVEDERVRDVHSEFNGNTYKWSDPPGDGSAAEGTHPGTGIFCRCWSEPVLPADEQ